jgi:hypothetical protein
MMVRKVIGPWKDWFGFANSCLVLPRARVGLDCYVGDPFGEFGPALRIGRWHGYDGVFESYASEGWTILYVGNPQDCGGLRVEVLIARGSSPDLTEFYWVLGGKFGRRLDATHYATGDNSF